MSDDLDAAEVMFDEWLLAEVLAEAPTERPHPSLQCWCCSCLSGAACQRREIVDIIPTGEIVLAEHQGEELLADPCHVVDHSA